MVIIPHALMMSEFHAKADPKYGHVHRLNTRLLGSDNGLALYIMQEILKEERSFYWPYLRMLPTPCNLRNWNRENLLLLQDHKLVRRTAARSRQLLALYRETIEFLSSSYPELYTVSRRFDFWHPESRLMRLRVSCTYPCARCVCHAHVRQSMKLSIMSDSLTNVIDSRPAYRKQRDNPIREFARGSALSP